MPSDRQSPPLGKPNLRRDTPALDQQPEREAVRHSGVDGVPAPAPHRKSTLVGIGAATGETAATMPAPERHPLRKTWHIPTPPSALAQARRSDPPMVRDSQPPEEAPQSLPEATETILRRELAEERAKTAKLERDARAQAEVRSPAATFPPTVQAPRHPSPAPSSAPAKVDQAIGFSLRYLLGKAAPYLIAAAGVGGGVTAVAKPGVDPAKADAVLASQEAMRADVALLREQVAGMLKREAARDQYTVCLEEALEDIGSQLLPAQDRQGSAVPLRAWIRQRCQRLRP